VDAVLEALGDASADGRTALLLAVLLLARPVEREKSDEKNVEGAVVDDEEVLLSAEGESARSGRLSGLRAVGDLADGAGWCTASSDPRAGCGACGPPSASISRLEEGGPAPKYASTADAPAPDGEASACMYIVLALDATDMLLRDVRGRNLPGGTCSGRASGELDLAGARPIEEGEAPPS
jgi:hypothetical protein